MKNVNSPNQALIALLPSFLALTACGSGGSSALSSTGRMQNIHQELTITDPSVSGSSVSSMVLNVGSIYLESQIAPVSVSGASLQASDVFSRGLDSYISYSAFDNGGPAAKIGAIERVSAYNCDNVLTLGRTEHCLSVGATYDFPNADIFSSFSDGTNLYAVGSTSDETDYPHFAKIYKLSLDANKNPASVLLSATLPSFAGTGVTVVGSRVLATSGTSTDSSRMGGLSVLNTSNLAPIAFQQLYDARSVSVFRNATASAYVARGKIDSGNLGALVEYNSDGSGSAIRTIASGGNTIAESKSSVQVGNTLLLASLGDQGFKVLCKSTGAVLHSQPAVTVSGIPSDRTVTNSVTAAPGYIFAANGEAGVYIYQFRKSSLLNSNYCQGVSVTLLGRLSLASTGTYVNSELSANGVYYSPIFNLLNVITAKLVVVASGNKGVSLINISNLNLSTTDVDDF